MPLDHAIVLVKHLVQMKTENYELEAYIRDMQAKMQEAGVEVPAKPTQDQHCAADDGEDAAED